MPSPKNGGYSPVGRDGMDELEQVARPNDRVNNSESEKENATGGSRFNTARFKAMVRASYTAKTGGKKLLTERDENDENSGDTALPKGPLPDAKPVSYKKKLARLMSRDGCTEGDRKRKAERAKALEKDTGERVRSGNSCGGGDGGIVDVVTSMFDRKVRFDVESMQHTPVVSKTKSRAGGAPPQTPGTPGVPKSACGWLSCPAPNFGWDAPETPKGSKPMTGKGIRA
jgi:hypothetical protein